MAAIAPGRRRNSDTMDVMQQERPGQGRILRATNERRHLYTSCILAPGRRDSSCSLPVDAGSRVVLDGKMQVGSTSFQNGGHLLHLKVVILVAVSPTVMRTARRRPRMMYQSKQKRGTPPASSKDDHLADRRLAQLRRVQARMRPVKAGQSLNPVYSARTKHDSYCSDSFCCAMPAAQSQLFLRRRT